MSISLVPHVPDDLIIRRIKYIVKGYGKFNNTKTGTKMSGVVTNHIYNELLSSELT